MQCKERVTWTFVYPIQFENSASKISVIRIAKLTPHFKGLEILGAYETDFWEIWVSK